MFYFFLMTLNGWAAYSLANTASELKRAGQPVKWWLHALGAANVFFFIMNAIVFFGS